MKNIKYLIGIFLILTAFTFTSCENEPIDPAININTCDEPSSLQVSDFVNNSIVNLTWLPGGNETSWTIEYGVQGFALGTGTTIVSPTNSATIAGLNSGNSYSFYVKSNCSAEESSQWVGPVTVQAVVNPNCGNPTNLTVARNATQNTTVNVAWAAGGTETSWEIQYGTTGFPLGNGITVASTTLTKEITDIAATGGYDFYVRAKCTATEFSSWVGPINVAAVNNTGGTVAGTYRLTAFNTSVPTDLNNDGTASVNQMNETACMNDMFLTLNANNTFISDSKGTDIDFQVDAVTGETVETITCFTDPDLSGTWTLSGNILSLTYTDPETGDVMTDNFNVVGNTLVYTINDGAVVGTEVTTGAPVYLTCDISLIYTKQ